MDKENIVGYLDDINFKMREGKFIQANKDLMFLIKCVETDVRREKDALVATGEGVKK